MSIIKLKLGYYATTVISHSLLNISKEHAYNRIKLTSDGIKAAAQIQCLHTDPVSTHAVGMIGLDCFIGTGIE